MTGHRFWLKLREDLLIVYQTKETTIWEMISKSSGILISDALSNQNRTMRGLASYLSVTANLQGLPQAD